MSVVIHVKYVWIHPDCGDLQLQLLFTISVSHQPAPELVEETQLMLVCFYAALTC